MVTANQATFNAFRDQGKPESSWAYEAAVRTNRSSNNNAVLTGQITYYHVDFSNRLLTISTNPGTPCRSARPPIALLPIRSPAPVVPDPLRSSLRTLLYKSGKTYEARVDRSIS